MYPGTGQPSALLIHGVQSSRLTWWRVQARLADLGWQVSAVDLAGHGERAFVDAEIATLTDLAVDVDDQIGGADFDVVVGHSLGALVALTLCARRPDVARALVIEDPPGMGADPIRTAADIEVTVAAARAEPEQMVAELLAQNPLWAETDARNAVTSRARLDVGPVTRSLRANQWDLPALVAACPVPVHLLVAEGPATALGEPDRSTIIAGLPADAVTVVPSGHSIHRDQPDRWLEVVTSAGQRANG